MRGKLQLRTGRVHVLGRLGALLLVLHAACGVNVSSANATRPTRVVARNHNATRVKHRAAATTMNATARAAATRPLAHKRANAARRSSRKASAAVDVPETLEPPTSVKSEDSELELRMLANWRARAAALARWDEPLASSAVFLAGNAAFAAVVLSRVSLLTLAGAITFYAVLLCLPFVMLYRAATLMPVGVSPLRDAFEAAAIGAVPLALRPGGQLVSADALASAGRALAEPVNRGFAALRAAATASPPLRSLWVLGAAHALRLLGGRLGSLALLWVAFVYAMVQPVAARLYGAQARSLASEVTRRVFSLPAVASLERLSQSPRIMFRRLGHLK